MKQKRALFVGRFQPFHNGHLFVVQQMAKQGYQPIIVIGSAYQSYLPNNPFSASERFEMISGSLEGKGIQAIIIPVADIHRYGVWPAHITDLVPEFQAVFSNSSIILELFRKQGIKVVSTKLFFREFCSGTEIRQRLRNGKEWREFVPKEVAGYLEKIKAVERMKML